MSNRSKRIIAGVTAGAILSTMAGCKAEDNPDLEVFDSTSIESSTYEYTTEEELTKLFEECDISLPKEIKTEKDTKEKTHSIGESKVVETTSGSNSVDITAQESHVPKQEPMEQTTALEVPISVGTVESTTMKNEVVDDTVENENDIRGEDEYEKFLEDYQKMVDMNNLGNVLIVIPYEELDDTYGAIYVVKSPNYKYYLQYENEEAKNNALQKYKRLEELGLIMKVFENEFRRIKS